MPDVYAHITDVDETTLEQVAAAMELRATDPRQQEILATYLARIEWPTDARVVEIGTATARRLRPGGGAGSHLRRALVPHSPAHRAHRRQPRQQLLGSRAGLRRRRGRRAGY